MSQIILMTINNKLMINLMKRIFINLRINNRIFKVNHWKKKLLLKEFLFLPLAVRLQVVLPFKTVIDFQMGIWKIIKSVILLFLLSQLPFLYKFLHLDALQLAQLLVFLSLPRRESMNLCVNKQIILNFVLNLINNNKLRVKIKLQTYFFR